MINKQKKVATQNDSHICGHVVKSNYSVLVPNQHLQPINGKITWNVDEASMSTDMDKYKIIFAFEQAFKEWEKVLHPIIFQPTGNINEAQIVIRFKNNGDQGLPFPFEAGVLAYAFSPSGTSFGMASDMYVNDAYKWDELHKPGSIYLFKVVVHELGHALNIGHQTSDINDIMYPIYQPNGDVIMNADTRKGLSDLYGRYGVGGVVQPPVVTPVPSPTEPVIQLPTPTPLPKQDTNSFIKLIFKSPTDLRRLSLQQINDFIMFLGLPKTNQSIAVKVNKIWSTMFEYKTLKR